jgi:hypothetical protein
MAFTSSNQPHVTHHNGYTTITVGSPEEDLFGVVSALKDAADLIEQPAFEVPHLDPAIVPPTCHNDVEKRRRAYLSACFKHLQSQIPSVMDVKTSNAGILTAAQKFIIALQEQERAMLQEKIALSHQRAILMAQANMAQAPGVQTDASPKTSCMMDVGDDNITPLSPQSHSYSDDGCVPFSANSPGVSSNSTHSHSDMELPASPQMEAPSPAEGDGLLLLAEALSADSADSKLPSNLFRPSPVSATTQGARVSYGFACR